MLLRASRNSAELTKRAEEKVAIPGIGRIAKSVAKLPGRVGRSISRGVKDPLGSVGKFVWKHPVGTLAAVGGTAAGAAGVAEGVRRGSGGMDPPYPQVRAPGMYSF